MAAALAVSSSQLESGANSRFTRACTRKRDENKANIAGRREPKRLIDAVLFHAAQLFADGEQEEYSRIIGRRLGITEARVDKILTAQALHWQRRTVSLEQGMKAAIEMSQEAGESVLDEM